MSEQIWLIIIEITDELSEIINIETVNGEIFSETEKLNSLTELAKV